VRSARGIIRLVLTRRMPARYVLLSPIGVVVECLEADVAETSYRMCLGHFNV
jgi:hypothetical protein